MMSDDIVKRLRDRFSDTGWLIYHEALAEIESLRIRIAELEAENTSFRKHYVTRTARDAVVNDLKAENARLLARITDQTLEKIMSVDLVSDVAKNAKWTNFLDGKRWYKSETDETVMVEIDWSVVGGAQRLTSDGLVALITELLKRPKGKMTKMLIAVNDGFSSDHIYITVDGGEMVFGADLQEAVMKCYLAAFGDRRT